MSDLDLFLVAVVLIEVLLYLRLERRDRNTTITLSSSIRYKKGEILGPCNMIPGGLGKEKYYVVIGADEYSILYRPATRWDLFLDFVKHLTAMELLPLAAALLILIGFLVKILL